MKGQYKISMSGFHRKLLLSWSEEAEAADALQLFYLEWKTICDKLQAKPLTWGDPLYDLKHANIRVFRGLSSRFIVNYAVDFDRREVIIKDILPRHGSGFQLPSDS